MADVHSAPFSARAKARGLTLAQRAATLPPERQYTVFLVALLLVYVAFMWYLARDGAHRSQRTYEVVHVVIDSPPHAGASAREGAQEQPS